MIVSFYLGKVMHLAPDWQEIGFGQISGDHFPRFLTASAIRLKGSETVPIGSESWAN